MRQIPSPLQFLDFFPIVNLAPPPPILIPLITKLLSFIVKLLEEVLLRCISSSVSVVQDTILKNANITRITILKFTSLFVCFSFL